MCETGYVELLGMQVFNYGLLNAKVLSKLGYTCDLHPQHGSAGPVNGMYSGLHNSPPFADFST